MVKKIKEFINNLFLIDSWEIVTSLDKETLKIELLEKFNYRIPSNNRWNIFKRDELYECAFEGDRFTIEIENNKSSVGAFSIFSGELIEEGSIVKIKMQSRIIYHFRIYIIVGVCALLVTSILSNNYVNLIFMIGSMTIGIFQIKIYMTNENQKFVFFFNSKIPR